MFQKEYQTRFNSELYSFCVNLDNLIATKKPFNRVKATNDLIEQIYNTALKLVDYQLYVDWQYTNYKKKYIKESPYNDLVASNMSNEQKHKKGKNTSMVSSKTKHDYNTQVETQELIHEKPQDDDLILIKTLLKQEDVSKKIQDTKLRLSQDYLTHRQLQLTLNGLENQEKDLKVRETNFNNDLANIKNEIVKYIEGSKMQEQQLQQQIVAQQDLINNLNKQQEVNAAHFKEQIEIATEVGKKQLFQSSSEGARKSAAQEDLCNQLSSECSIYREQLAELKGHHQQLVAKLQLLHATNKDASSRLEANYQNWTIQLENEYQDIMNKYDSMVAEQIRANEELTDLKLAKDDNELKDLENQKAQTLANFINELKNEIQQNKQEGIDLAVENRQLREQLQAQEQERDSLIKKGKELDLLKEGKERIMLETTLKIIHQMREENDIIKRKLTKERDINSRQRDTIRSFMIQSPAGQRRNFDVEKQLEILTQRVNSKSHNKRQQDVQKKIDDIQQIKMAKMEKMLAINHLREHYLYNAQIHNITSGQNQTTFRDKQMQEAYKQHKYNQTKASAQPRNMIKVHQKIF